MSDLRSQYPEKDTPYEIITSSYVLVTDPQKSSLVSLNTKSLSLIITSTLSTIYTMRSGEFVTHFITVDAVDQRKGTARRR